MAKKLKIDPLREMRQGKPLTVSATSNHRTVFVHETDAASLVGGKRHVGSGALAGLKSDGSSERYQVEAKQTRHQEISLTLAWLKKITQEALGAGRVPIMHIRFLNRDPEVERDWVVMSVTEFKRLFDLARGQNTTLKR